MSSIQGKKFSLKDDSRLLCLDRMFVLLNKAYYLVWNVTCIFATLPPPPNGQQGESRDVWIYSIIMLSYVFTDFHENGKSTLIGVEYKPMLPVA